MFREVSVAGAPYERGSAYGRAVGPLVRHSIASYARLFAYRRGLDWAAVQAEAMGFAPLLAEVSPDLLEEMRGIGAGSGRALAEIVALNVRTELLAGIGAGVYHPEGAAALARNRAAGVPEHPAEDDRRPTADEGGAASYADGGECTTVAAAAPATSAGGTLLAQTWDWTGEQRAACVLLRVRAPGEPEILTLTEAGMVAKVGMSSAGLAVALNLLRSYADGRAVGLPVHVLLRKMLQARSFAEARAVAGVAPPSASSCVTLAGAAGELVSLEITPAGVAEVWGEGGLLAHANHCVDPGAIAGERPLDPVSTSCERAGRGWELLRAGAGRLDVAAMQAILGDHGGEPRCICRHPNPGLAPLERVESIFGVVMDLGAGIVHVAPGVPCAVAFSPAEL